MQLIQAILGGLLIFLGTLNVIQGGLSYFLSKGAVDVKLGLTCAVQAVIAILLMFAGFYIINW